jgi:hypothetical protein
MVNTLILSLWIPGLPVPSGTMSLTMLSLMLLAALVFLALLLCAAIASFARLFFAVPFRAAFMDSLKPALLLAAAVFVLVMTVRLIRNG